MSFPFEPWVTGDSRPGLSRFALGFIAMLCALFVCGVAAAQSKGEGTVSGRLFDSESGESIPNATIILGFPDPGDGSEPRQEVATTGPEGDYEFGAVPAGFYSLSFIKSGYRASVIPDFEVVAGRDSVADFPLPRVQTTASGEILELGEFVVEASVVGELMNNLEMRMDSDQLVNLLSADDLSKFAASDVADALKRVAGVNIVEGQFAIIRGLEDRYSSTLYNGAPVPSPDPESQSVQLDLFPSDIVSNLNIAKSFAAYSPSNSAGGAIDIVTHDYPEELTFKFTAGTGFNDRALDEFLRYDSLSPIGVSEDGKDVIDSDFAGFIGGRTEFFDREFRFKFVGANEVDHRTANGTQGALEPRQPLSIKRPDGTIVFTRESGGLSKGVLDRPGVRFDTVTSVREEQTTYYGGFGFDLDKAGDHRIDGSIFYTNKKDEEVTERSRGNVPGFDYVGEGFLTDSDSPIPSAYSRDVAATWAFDWRPDDRELSSGRHRYDAPIYEGRTFDRSRDMTLYQLNGDHDLAALTEGLSLTWAANYAETHQDEVTFIARYSFDPNDANEVAPRIPSQPEDFAGGGVYGIRSDLLFGKNDIDENQYFGRADLEYEFEPLRNVAVTALGGIWWEQANRNVDSRFEVAANGDPTQPGVATQSGGVSNNFTVLGDSPVEMGRRIYRGAQLDLLEDTSPSTSRTKREISAYYGELKMTLFEDWDLIGGLRLENIRITTVNDPFTGFCGSQPVNPDGSCPTPGAVENLFPTRYLFFDRQDNPALGELPAAPGTLFNDQIVGIDVPIDPVTGFVDCRTRECLDPQLRGEINDTRWLPAVSLAYRPIEGVALRFAYSKTVARPSFRELGYYPSLESGSDDILVGNPQLDTSDVESFDARVEWTFGDFGDLLAASVFYKTIENPIEPIVIRDPSNADCTGVCEFRTFTNTPSDGDLVGLELEGRKTFDFIKWRPARGFFEAFSVGGNFTYIDAEVERNQFQRDNFSTFLGITDADRDAGLERFSRIKKKRRLFGQPEWIANADVTFDHKEWGTRATLSIFGISEVLDAVGGARLGPGNIVEGLTLDRYIDEFYQLDLVMSQSFALPWVPGEITGKASIKNLTDTTRKVIYDQSQTTDDFRERSFKVGRDFSFSVGYTLTY